MKIWNRFISFALATTLLLTVPLVSFAAGTKNSTSSDFTTVQSASGELLVRAYDLDNGDSVFEQYNDGKLVSRYTVDRSKNVINELVYSSDGTSKQLQRFIPTEKNFDIVLPQSTMSRRLGRIRFQYTDGTGTGICGAYDMLRKQREELLEDVPNEPDAAPVPDDAAVSTDNIERLTELIGQMKPMYRDPLRLLAMGYTNREIAKSLGLTDEVVRTRLFRGRKLLWKEMNSHE